MTSRKNAVAVLVAVLLTGCLLGASGAWLWKQQSQSPVDLTGRYSQHDHSTRIFDKLQITQEQETQLREILEESRREINACREELQGKMDDIRTDTNAKIAAILDENQKSIFESIIKEAELQRGGGRHGRGRMSNGH
ncbi:MAG: hypothetical protein JXR49_01490 [Acidobacteria bacterium]|nr:hypothetical protein [Acidobacteriota bacterium]